MSKKLIIFVSNDDISKLVDQLAEKIVQDEISFREAARQIGVSAMAVSDWIRGRKRPTGLSIPAIADFLGVPRPGRPILKRAQKDE